MVIPNKTIPRMKNKEIFNHPSERVNNYEIGTSENLNINLMNSFQYLNIKKGNNNVINSAKRLGKYNKPR